MPAVEQRVHQFQRAGVPLAREIPDRIESADETGDHRSCSGTGNPPVEHDDEQCVKRHVGHRADNRHDCAELRLLSRHVKRLEAHLQHETRQADGADAAVDDTLAHHLSFRTEQPGQRFHQEVQRHHEHERQDDRKLDEHRKDPLGAFTVALAHGHRDERRAARADHQTQRPDQHDGRPDHIERGKGRRPHEIRHEQPVHHAVDAHHEYHQHARYRRHDQATISIMSVQCDLHKLRLQLQR